MNAKREHIKDRPLNKIVVPATHDSGMSRIDLKFPGVGSPANTQTQGLTFFNPLKAGARWFDVRVVLMHKICDVTDYEFVTAHLSSSTGDLKLGGVGETLKEVIDALNDFNE
jgi:hypothetical protein